MIVMMDKKKTEQDIIEVLKTVHDPEIPINIYELGLIYEINWVSRLLSTKYFQLFGKSSYTFYLIHMGVVYNLILFCIPFDRYFIPFVLLNVIAIVLYTYVEHPLNIYFRSSSKSVPIKTAAAA